MAGLILAMAVTIGVVGGGPAGAATELTLSPASGPPGTEFVVTGTGFAALPVEIRWGGQAGPVIATAIGPEFSVTAVVPDSPPNSHPVLAVVTDGSSVSTSSASFQVTNSEAPPPEETTTSTTATTSTTLAQPPATSPPATAGGSDTGRSIAPAPTAGRGGASGGVDGGVEADTTGSAGNSSAAAAGTPSGSAGTGTGTGAGPTGGSTATTAPAALAGDSTSPIVTLPPAGGPGPAPTAGQGTATAPKLPGDGATAAALAPARTNQSAGAVSNPALLFLGLALVFGGGVFLAVHNRHRAS